MIEIDLLSDGSEYDYDQIILLDSRNYRLRMLYNDRCSVWTMSLYLEDGTPLIEGQRVVLYTNLLDYCAVEGRPPGNLFCDTYTQDTNTPGLEDLGNDARCRVFYIPLDELS